MTVSLGIYAEKGIRQVQIGCYLVCCGALQFIDFSMCIVMKVEHFKRAADSTLGMFLHSWRFCLCKKCFCIACSLLFLFCPCLTF